MQEDDEDRPEGNGPDGNTGLHDLGVLFVHGIGTQRRGETLSRCTGALYRWLEKWFSGSATAWLQPRLSDAWLVAEDAGFGYRTTFGI